MKRSLRLFRLLVIAVLSLLVAVPVALYVMLSTPWAQSRLCAVAERELTALLGSRVEVGAVELHPFNRVEVRDIKVNDDNGRPCLQVRMLGARFELYHFLRTRRIVFDYALVDRPTLHISRPADGAPLNIAGIIARLKGDGKRPPARFRFKVATLALRDGRATYDVLDAPAADSARFDPRHIALDGLQLHACLRLVSNDIVNVELDRLAFSERSGLTLKDLSALIQHDADGLRVSRFRMELPNSSLAFDASWTRRGGSWTFRTDTVEPSLLYLPDVAAFAPVLADSYIGVDLRLDAHGDSTSATIPQLDMSTRDEALSLHAEGGAIDIGNPGEQIWLRQIALRADAGRLAEHLRRFMPAQGNALRKLELLGHADINANATLLSRSDLAASFSAFTSAGRVHAKAHALSADTFATAAIRAEAQLADIPAGALTGVQRLGKVNARLTADGRTDGKGFDGQISLADASVDFNGAHCDGIHADAIIGHNDIEGNVRIASPAVRLELELAASTGPDARTLDAEGSISRLDFAGLGIASRYDGYVLSTGISAALRGRDIDDVAGRIELSDISFSNDEGSRLTMKQLRLTRDTEGRPQTVELASDYINGRIEGNLVPSALAAECRQMAAAIFPALELAPAPAKHTDATPCGNDFSYEFTVAEAEELCRFFSLPVQIIHPIEISGDMHCGENGMTMSIDAPYLQQGDKIIDNTALYFAADGPARRASLYATVHMPTKKGPMAAILNVGAADNHISTAVDWTIERKIPLNGTLAFGTTLGLGADRRVAAAVDIRPGTVNFGDDVWDILPSHLEWSDGAAIVEGFALEAGDQRIAVDGTVSPLPEPTLEVAIDRVHLLPVFETLEIDKALISGTATGVFECRGLLGQAPVLTSERLHVDDIGYNRCTIGDADILAAWDNDTRDILLNADVTAPDGRHSYISGSIGPASETLDITFRADRVPVGFMQPYMSAFASEVAGYASGRARLFGTFKYIDLEGDIYADSLALKVDFTNTRYFCNDSIHLRPGLIEVPRATIRDINGHTAMLDGIVRHKFFKEPSFDFKVTDAREFLCYDVTSRQSPDWYGTIFGRGGAHIYGEPGVVNIDVSMTTTTGSVFTFVLSDMMEADEYSFITFRDRTPVEVRDSVVEVEAIPQAVLDYQKRMTAAMEDTPSDYNMDFRVDVTPDARVNIVMDPVGGDEIKAYGSGNLRLTYGSANNDLRMFGTYVLDRGSYNFTLQDIIIKDFTIDEGSSISFHGDPYAAQLNIEAAYSVNANLSDLDESFLQDRDLNRTNVPVQALMKVTGDMRQPDIAFDLRFPTLTSDVYRKVRSIVSTEDMMNRQIIYLLALNRFYTPDYMSTTKGNELFSVASSTISSQLSSMLGKLSDNWTIAPNLRSDRGDFSDVEVDVALSSRLLNNRLLFNGNFGYRDKSLNTNQFVGDFDIEYLLNRRGTWRLKAYNRYNDQNYYLRTAATTQGIGIMFKRDFDSLLAWLKPLRRKKAAPTPPPAPADSTQATPPHE